MKVIASSLRKGNVVEMDGKLYAVLKAENFHPGKGTPTTSVDMRRISDGVKVSERWRTTEMVEKATVDEREYDYLYSDSEGYHFMEPNTYEQLTATEQRLSLMLVDYRERHRQQLQAGQLMGDQINSQRFIQQLQQLHTHAMREAHQCEAQCAQHQKTLVRMQLELDKMKKLAEQDDKRLHKLAEKVEARRLDEMAVMRFRFRQA